MMGNPFTVNDDVIRHGDPNPLETLRREATRQFVHDYLEREAAELRHLVTYPGASGYGRHANDGGPGRPLIKDVHYPHVGGEYPGRHRLPEDWLSRPGTVAVSGRSVLRVVGSHAGQWIRL